MAGNRHRVYRAVLVLGAIAAAALLWERLPERMATHWGLDGRADGWGGRFEGALMLPLIALGVWVMAELLPRIDPRGENFSRMRGAYDLTISATITLVVAIQAMMLAIALGHPVPVARVIPAAVGVLIVVLGNVLPQARPNWWFGIRTPWTLSNDRVWARTHRVGGWLFVASGLALLVAAVTLPPTWTAGTLIVGVLLMSLGTLAYSYVVWRQETRK